MTTAYTSLLGLALPVTGELNGTWGDVVNNSITNLLDSAIAGTTTLSTDADVTLTTTTGSANQAREAIILWTATGTVTRNITAPAQSKIYNVINKSGGTQSIVIRGAGPTTGVTVPKGKAIQVVWNGSDFVELSPNSITGNLTLGGNLLFSPDATYDIGASGATRPRTIYLSNSLVAGGNIAASGSTHQFNTAAANTAIVNINTTASSAANNIVGIFQNDFSSYGGFLGTRNLAADQRQGLFVQGTGSLTLLSQYNIDFLAGQTSVPGAADTGLAMRIYSAGNIGMTNGLLVEKDSASAGNSTALTLVNGAGSVASVNLDFYTGANSVSARIRMNTISTNRGDLAFYVNNGSSLSQAAYFNSANYGFYTGYDSNINGLTVGKGLNSVSTNTAFGVSALASNTSGANNVAIGYTAGTTITSGGAGTYIGTASGNLATGGSNTFLGCSSGETITSGYNHTIIGRYNGNQNGLDIRTANNFIVLSDGNGNVPILVDNNQSIAFARGSIASNPTYGKKVVAQAGSAFNNPTTSLLTATLANNYNQILVKVRQFQIGLSQSFASVQVAYATANNVGGSYVTTAVVENGAGFQNGATGSANLMTLSWGASGNNYTLSVTGSRQTNFDQYFYEVTYAFINSGTYSMTWNF